MIFIMSKDSLQFHKELKGKIQIRSKVKLNRENLCLAYTPGVGQISTEIAKDKTKVNELTGRSNKVAIVTDGSAVLGLGNIGPEAALPVMEGKAAIFADFAGINAVPVCLATQDPKEIIKTVKYLAPSFGGINLEDIAAPACFEVERQLIKDLEIPVFHDDQHGTAIVVLAGLFNALKVVGKNKKAKIVISGAGAAGLSIADLLFQAGFKNFCLCDSKGVVVKERKDLNEYKRHAIANSKSNCAHGSCKNVIEGADVFIGVSKPKQLTKTDIKQMAPNPIIFALANPIPEILPEEAEKGGAAVIATGRSDFPNQINNALVFPGLFRGLLDNNVRIVTPKLQIAVAEAITGIVKKPSRKNIIPSIFDRRVVQIIAETVKVYSKKS